MGRLRPAPTRNCHRALEWSAKFLERVHGEVVDRADRAKVLLRAEHVSLAVHRYFQASMGRSAGTARYARVATGLISAVESPLDHLNQRRKPKKPHTDPPPAK